MDFKEVRLKRSVQAVQITADNLEEIRDAFDGDLNQGVLKIKDSDSTVYLIINDWLVVYDSGDLAVYNDEEFNRLFEDAPIA